mmetsp:Transcript_10321/g.30293  ORF Transcript_10321/g.30293 Transcript_10321/m.30293 type:complete len:160 (-) Transcript_10321:1274-1753(-)
MRLAVAMALPLVEVAEHSAEFQSDDAWVLAARMVLEAPPGRPGSARRGPDAETSERAAGPQAGALGARRSKAALTRWNSAVACSCLPRFWGLSGWQRSAAARYAAFSSASGGTNPGRSCNAESASAVPSALVGAVGGGGGGGGLRGGGLGRCVLLLCGR